MADDAAKSGEKLPKDRECPFCHQAFTSSSLGRHLDLYIKERNPKPPDGVHDVEAIRRLRGKITRRQPRQHPRPDGSTTSSSKATPLPERISPLPIRNVDHLNGEAMEPMRTFINRANWQATGVIKDLPHVSRTTPGDGRAEVRPDSSLAEDENGTRAKETYNDAIDQGRAAELALKEVLESVKIANQHAFPPRPFDINFFSLTLPQIYLQCLKPPPELLAEPPSWARDLAWTVQPPLKEQYEAVRAWLVAKLSDWRRRYDRTQESISWPDADDADLKSRARAADVPLDQAMYYQHLEKAFVQWFELSHEQQQEQWHFECAKAFARERELRQATQRKLDHADLELARLNRRLDRLAFEWPPTDQKANSTTGFSLSREALSHLPASTDLDHHALIAKWRGRLQSARSAQHPSSLLHERHRHRESPPSPSPTSPDSMAPDEGDDVSADTLCTDRSKSELPRRVSGKEADPNKRTKEPRYTRTNGDGPQAMDIG